MSKEFSVIGKPLPRIEGKIKATGEAIYCPDIVLSRMLYGKLLRSTYPHARILNIETSKAKKLKGVKAIITGRDTLGEKYGRLPHLPTTVDEYGLAVDKARYIGDELAAVAAVDEETAEEALDLIQVDFEPLPAVFEPIEAMSPNAPKIHNVERNIAWEVDCQYGDTEKGFSESDHVQEDEFTIQGNIHCQLETRASLASYDASGKLTVWASNQSPYFLRKDLAKLLGMPEGDIRIILPHIGGGFGGKRELWAGDFCAALLSRLARRPVKIVNTRDEEFLATRRRHAMIIRLKTGVKRDGKLVAQECTAIADGGAYNSTGPIVIGRVGAHLNMQYRLDNFKCKAYLVYTNKPVAGAFRGFGFLQACFANESQLDMIAQNLGIDPIELRLRNAFESGDVNALDYRILSCGLKECLQKTSRAARWKEAAKSPHPSRFRRGIGMSASSYIAGTMELGTAAFLELYSEGWAKLLAGGVDLGQGSDTALCQIAAEELGISLDAIKMAPFDTDYTPIDLGSYASRTTIYAGNAARAAAADARRQVLESAAVQLEAHPDDLTSKEGLIFVKGSPERGIDFFRAVAMAGRPIMGKGCYNPPVQRFEFDALKTLRGNTAPAYSYGATAVEVEVDTETGQVKVVQAWAVHDCGRVLNLLALEGQVEGSIVMGMGQGLYEDVWFHGGSTLNSSFVLSGVPSIGETPQIYSAFVESLEPGGPFGAKGVSEGTKIPLAPAIANAILDAVGVRVKSLPITPDKVLAGLAEGKHGRA